MFSQVSVILSMRGVGYSYNGPVWYVLSLSHLGKGGKGEGGYHNQVTLPLLSG